LLTLNNPISVLKKEEPEEEEGMDIDGTFNDCVFVDCSSTYDRGGQFEVEKQACRTCRQSGHSGYKFS
jgi:hypothetical protein